MIEPQRALARLPESAAEDLPINDELLALRHVDRDLRVKVQPVREIRIAVTGMTCKVQTRGMTMQNWFANAEVISEEEITAEEAVSFGKRTKKTAEEQ